MKRLLIIGLLLALVATFIGGLVSVSAVSPITDKGNGLYSTKVATETVEIGNIAKDGTAFKPNIKFWKWDESYVAFSLNTAVAFAPSTAGSSITASSSLMNIEFTPAPVNTAYNDIGGYDLNITLKAKPPSNQLQFAYDSQLANAYLQPSFTKVFTVGQVLDGGRRITSVTDTTIIDDLGNIVEYRPDYVVNSIAFYGNKAGDFTALGGKNYAAGKIGHLYRMKGTDAKGNWAWADWNLSGNTISLIIDSAFLNSATYPVTIAPVGDTFGYTTHGGGSTSLSANEINTCGDTYLGAAGTGVSMTFYGKKTSAGTANWQGAVYNSDSTLLTNGNTGSVGVTNTLQEWTANFASAPTFTVVQYYLPMNMDASITVYYDTTGVNVRKYAAQTFGTWPAGPISWTNGGGLRQYTIFVTYTAGGVVVPTVTTQAASSVEATTATGNGNITNTGGENCDIRGIQWGTSTGVYTTNVTESGSYGTGAFTESLTSLPTGTTIYMRAEAHNSAGWGYGSEVTCLTKPAAPTNVAATDGTYTDKVTITWTKSTGATNYHVWRDAVDLGAAGDVATFNDTGADAPTITAGSSVASDGTSTAQVDLSLSGTSVNNGITHTYKVVASNATGNSADSTTNTGYRGHGSLTYQWQRSAGDSDASYSNIDGATSSTYADAAAPAPTVTPGTASSTDGSATNKITLSISEASANNGAGRYYKCVLNATGATQQTSTANRGYIGVGSLTYQWYRSAGDSDASYSSLAGATTAPYDDTTAPAPTITAGTASASDGTSSSYVTLSIAGESANNGAGRYYYCTVSATGAANQDTTHDRGYVGVGVLTYQWQRSSADSDADYSDISGATTNPYNDTGAPADGSGRYYKCVLSADGAIQQTTNAERGYRGVNIPTVDSVSSSSVEETTATATGNITATTANCTSWGIQYGYVTGTYTANVTETGSHGIGTFNENLTGLNKGDEVFWRAFAINTGGIAYGSELTFLTKPDEPTSLASPTQGYNWIDLNWTPGAGSDNTTIRYRTDGVYPTTTTDGTLAYSGSASTANVTGLASGTEHKFRAWSYATEGGLEQYSDLTSDVTANTTAIGGPTVTTNAATLVEETTATLNGNVTSTGGEDVTRGFEWDTDLSAPFSDNWTEGVYGIGAYTHDLNSLNKGDKYAFRATANNTVGTGYGSILYFMTKPDPATGFTSTDNGSTWIYLGWTNGDGMYRVGIRYATGTYPTDNTTGTLGYWGNGTTANITGLSGGTPYYFKIFTHAYEDSTWSTADGSVTCQDTTDVGPPIVTNDGGASNITNISARLNGEIMATGGENPTVTVFWGLVDGGSNPVLWTDNASLGALPFGVFNHDIGGLIPSTLYYYNSRAVNSAGTAWPASSANFTTNAFATIGAPTGFTLTDLGLVTITANWTPGTSSTYTMIRGSRMAYPSTITEGELVYYNGGTSVNTTSYALDTTRFFFRHSALPATIQHTQPIMPRRRLGVTA